MYLMPQLIPLKLVEIISCLALPSKSVTFEFIVHISLNSLHQDFFGNLQVLQTYPICITRFRNNDGPKIRIVLRQAVPGIPKKSKWSWNLT